MTLAAIPSRMRRGFTLVEAALVTVIVGVGVVAMLQLLASGTAANSAGAELTVGMNLARNVREMAMGLSFREPESTHWGLESGESLTSGSWDDLDDLDGAEFCPPIDARRARVMDNAWKQTVAVESVQEDHLTNVVSRGSSDAVRVTVTVSRNNQEVCRLSWVAFHASP